MDLCTKKLGMQIELHRNNVYQGVELLLLVSMLFLLAIPKCLLIFKEIFITLFFLFLFFPLNICALLAHDAGLLWTQVVCEDLHTDVKGEYLGAGGNPIHTAFERGRSLSPRVLTYPNSAILLRSPERSEP